MMIFRYHQIFAFDLEQAAEGLLLEVFDGRKCDEGGDSMRGGAIGCSQMDSLAL
jgi:hypothetical protein